MNVLITGTSGLIGRALAESLSAAHTVTCLSRSHRRDCTVITDLTRHLSQLDKKIQKLAT